MRSSNLRCLVAAAALAACAAPEERAGKPLPMLDERPERAHEVIGPVEARGTPGMHVRYVYDELRRKARALGADAVVHVETRKLTDVTPLPGEPQERPQLGEPYPGPLEKFGTGAFPSYGFDVQTGGVYYVVEGLAIRYH